MSLPSLPLPGQSIKNSKQKIAEVIQWHAPQEILFKAARESARRQNQPVRVILPVDGPTYHAFKGSVPSPMNPRLDVFMINAPAEIKKPGKHKPSIGQALADVGLQPVWTNGGGGAIYLVPNDKNGAALYAKALFQAVAQPLFGLDRSLIPRGASAEFIQGLGDAYRGQTALNVLFGVNQGVSVMGGLGGPAAKFVAGRNIRKLPWDGRQKIDPKTATMNVPVISKEIIPNPPFKTKIVKTPQNSKEIIPKTPSTAEKAPFFPEYKLSRSVRSRLPEPILMEGVPHDLVGFKADNKILLRPSGWQRRIMPLRVLRSKVVEFEGDSWKVVNIHKDGYLLQYAGKNPSKNESTKLVSKEDSYHVRFKFPGGGEYSLGNSANNGVSLEPVHPPAIIEKLLTPGLTFQAYLKGRELEGPYTIKVKNDHSLRAKGKNHHGQPIELNIKIDELNTTYSEIENRDLGDIFHVRTFDVVEQNSLKIQFGRVSNNHRPDLLTNPAYNQKIIDKLNDPSIHGDVTIFTFRAHLHGDMLPMKNAIINYVKRNPTAKVTLIASIVDLGNGWKSPEVSMEDADIIIKQFHRETGATLLMPYGGTKGLINHAKGFIYTGPDGTKTGWISTASMIPDPRKVDVYLPLPAGLPVMILDLLHEMLIKKSANNSNKIGQIIKQLAKNGILFDSPKIPTCAQAMLELIRNSKNKLYVRVNELRDPRATQELINAARRGVQVEIGFRKIDDSSLKLLNNAVEKYKNISYKNTGTTDPNETFTHANSIIADLKHAYVGSAFFWGPMLPPKKNGQVAGGVEAGVLLTFDHSHQAIDLINKFEHKAR